MTNPIDSRPHTRTTATGAVRALLLIVPLALGGCGDEPRADATEVLPPQGPSFGERVARASAVESVVATAGVDSAPDRLEKKTDPPAAPVLEEVRAPAEAVRRSAEKDDGDDGARSISFQQLAGFEYETVDPLSMLQKTGEPKTDIPADIEALSGLRVKVDGFLMPTIFEDGKVERFLVTRSYITCCFGDVLNMNEVIDTTVGPDLEVSYFLSGQPVTVTGWFEVGEKKSEFGYVESIYRLVAEEVKERW